MLVLSRKKNDTIRFPELDITIEVVQLKGSNVRVGIDAPVEISIVRGELESDSKTVTKKVLVNEKTEHDLRNRLNSLAVAIAFSKKLVETGHFGLAADKLDQALQALGEQQQGDTSQLTALLVEDSANEREMLAGFLRLHGYEVQTVSDGIEALEFLENSEQPDLILMDMRMPRLDGPGTIRRIRENHAFDDVEIFAISGETAKASDIDVQKNRVAQWFQKPLQPNDLVNAINGHLARRTIAVDTCPN